MGHVARLLPRHDHGGNFRRAGQSRRVEGWDLVPRHHREGPHDDCRWRQADR
jgi:hypothetical protein